MDAPSGHSPAQELRALLRTGLVAAMKARRPEAVSALRTAIAAIENAEAVDAPAGPADPAAAGSEHVAGARLGVGSTEAPRRVLSAEDLRDLLRAQVAERRTEAERCAAHGRHDAAGRLRAEADVLTAYLA